MSGERVGAGTDAVLSSVLLGDGAGSVSLGGSSSLGGLVAVVSGLVLLFLSVWVVFEEGEEGEEVADPFVLVAEIDPPPADEVVAVPPPPLPGAVTVLV